MSFAIVGPLEWSMSRDAEGYRTYKLNTLVQSNNYADGPTNALLTPGMASPGAPWIYGNDVDMWVWCRQDATIEPVLQGEPNRHFKITQTFSNKPIPDSQQRPNSAAPTENPLMEPSKISGSFTRRTEEATVNQYGFLVLNSAFEQMRGTQMEFDISVQTIKIEQNLAVMNVAFHEYFMNALNSDVLWGFGPRCIKIMGITWDKKYHGIASYYYTRTIEFEINRLTWDRLLPDKATKALQGHWDASGQYVLENIDGNPPNPQNPTHFKAFKDKEGHATTVMLNGRGMPASVSLVNAEDLGKVGMYFVSLQAGNTGNALNSTSFWRQQNGGDAPWNSSTNYEAGQVVVYSDVTDPNAIEYSYIAKLANTNKIPLINPFSWEQLTNGITDKGDWLIGTTYALGDRVTYPLAAPTAIGQILVQKYIARPLVLLGIPLTF